MWWLNVIGGLPQQGLHIITRSNLQLKKKKKENKVGFSLEVHGYNCNACLLQHQYDAPHGAKHF